MRSQRGPPGNLQAKRACRRHFPRVGPSVQCCCPTSLKPSPTQDGSRSTHAGRWCEKQPRRCCGERQLLPCHWAPPHLLMACSCCCCCLRERGIRRNHHSPIHSPGPGPVPAVARLQRQGLLAGSTARSQRRQGEPVPPPEPPPRRAAPHAARLCPRSPLTPPQPTTTHPPSDPPPCLPLHLLASTCRPPPGRGAARRGRLRAERVRRHPAEQGLPAGDAGGSWLLG